MSQQANNIFCIIYIAHLTFKFYPRLAIHFYKGVMIDFSYDANEIQSTAYTRALLTLVSKFWALM